MTPCNVSQCGVAAVPSRPTLVNPTRFGRWAALTGASSGTGKSARASWRRPDRRESSHVAVRERRAEERPLPIGDWRQERTS